MTNRACRVPPQAAAFLLAASLTAVSRAGAAEPHPQQGRVTFESSDKGLVAGFEWARKQALAYVFHGDKVGDWYEASLPNRSAFCMRDVSHQSTGAQVLGLSDVTANMLRKFAANIAASRDWCTFWEIDKNDRPAPVDYRSDSDFWYCLPANFDVLSCCYRQYLWTGDRRYLSDQVFREFYRRTVSDYVKQWDKDGDGIPESYRKYGRRGLGSYTEDMELHPLVGSDLIAAEYAAFRAYARMQEITVGRVTAEEFSRKADRLRSLFNEKWWDAKDGRFYSSLSQDRSFHDRDPLPPFVLWFGIPDDGEMTDRTLDRLAAHPAADVEEMSYLPEIAYRYGRNEFAYSVLMQLTGAKLKRREYPEVSYAVVGAIASGTMGIAPDGSRGQVETLPRLTSQTAWAALRNVPVFGGEISVRHVGTAETELTNQSRAPLGWRAAFPVSVRTLLVDGAPVPANAGRGVNGQVESFVVLNVKPDQTRKVKVAQSVR